MKNIRTLPAIALLALLSSCYYNSRLVYLQDKNFSEFHPTIVQNKRSVYRLQTSDIVSVVIKSSTETEASAAVFNVASRQNGIYTSPGNLFLEGYTIDTNGKINIPIIGEMTLKDLTIEEAQRLIQANANKYLTKST